MSFFDHTSDFNRQRYSGSLPPQPLPIGKTSASPSQTEVRRWADRLQDVIQSIGHDLDAYELRALEDLLDDMRRAC